MNDRKLNWVVRIALLIGGSALTAGAPVAAAAAQSAVKAGALSPAAVPNSPITALQGIQTRIGQAAWTAFNVKNLGGYDPVIGDLRAIQAVSPVARFYKGYWLGYALYNKSLSQMRIGKRMEAKGSLEDAIRSLDGIATPNVEVHALLGVATGLNLQFVPRQSIMGAIGTVNGHLAAALAPRPTLRSYYAAAVSDWNTPVEYGGKKKAEPLVRQALALPPEINAGVGPTWGRDMATALLIRILRSQQRNVDATMLAQRAARDFPNSVAIAEVGQ